MDLRFTPEELAFREEVRAFIRDNLPADTRDRMKLGHPPRKGRHRPLAAHSECQGLGGLSWPKEWGGPGWTAIQKMIFLEENLMAPAPELSVLQHHHARSRADPVRHRRAEEALPAARGQPGRLVVPGLLRAWRRVRPRVVEDRGEAGRRSLRGERAEDLDLHRA